MADYRQLPLWADEPNHDPNQMSFAFDQDDHGRPISSGEGDYEVIDIEEMDDTTPEAAPGPAAILSVIPTSTTNPQRPRTLAAGYDHQRKTITVMFRDGTMWNYYGCSPTLWNSFKRAPSKGVFIATRLDPMGDYGPAETGDTDARQEAVANFARFLQGSGKGGNRIGYQYKKPYTYKSKQSGLPTPTYSQTRYRTEIRRLMDQGRSATDAVQEARRNLETRTRRR